MPSRPSRITCPSPATSRAGRLPVVLLASGALLAGLSGGSAGAATAALGEPGAVTRAVAPAGAAPAVAPAGEAGRSPVTPLPRRAVSWTQGGGAADPAGTVAPQAVSWGQPSEPSAPAAPLVPSVPGAAAVTSVPTLPTAPTVPTVPTVPVARLPRPAQLVSGEVVDAQLSVPLRATATSPVRSGVTSVTQRARSRATRPPVDVRRFGAVGDGRTDDTAALQRALRSVRPNSTLLLPRGRTFRHTDVLRISVPGTRLTGGGTLLATREERSAVWVTGDRVTVDGITLRMGATSKRWDAFEQMKLRVAADGVTVRRVLVDGAASAGIYVGDGSARFLVEDVTVRGTRSDGIHLTTRAQHGTVRRATVRGTGDDGIAIVSYAADGGPVHHVTVADSTVADNSWGRGFSVVGGEDVVLRDLVATRTSAAGLYLATEGAPYFTLPVRRVTVDRVTLVAANTTTSVDHGAVVLWAGRAGLTSSDLTLRSLTIRDTRVTSSRHVSVLQDGGAFARVRLTGVRISGGTETAWFSQVPRSVTVLQDWRQDGVPITP